MKERKTERRKKTNKLRCIDRNVCRRLRLPIQRLSGPEEQLGGVPNVRRLITSYAVMTPLSHVPFLVADSWPLMSPSF